jgi:hypothetical protein
MYRNDTRRGEHLWALPPARKRKTANSSRQNAFRHELTAETMIGPLDDPDDYRAFEQAVIAD